MVGKKSASKASREVVRGGETVADHAVFLLFLPTAEPSPRLLAYENRLSRATSRARLREQSLTRAFHCKV